MGPVDFVTAQSDLLAGSSEAVDVSSMQSSIRGSSIRGISKQSSCDHSHTGVFGKRLDGTDVSPASMGAVARGPPRASEEGSKELGDGAERGSSSADCGVGPPAGVVGGGESGEDEGGQVEVGGEKTEKRGSRRGFFHRWSTESFGGKDNAPPPNQQESGGSAGPDRRENKNSAPSETIGDTTSARKNVVRRANSDGRTSSLATMADGGGEKTPGVVRGGRPTHLVLGDAFGFGEGSALTPQLTTPSGELSLPADGDSSPLGVAEEERGKTTNNVREKGKQESSEAGDGMEEEGDAHGPQNFAATSTPFPQRKTGAGETRKRCGAADERRDSEASNGSDNGRSTEQEDDARSDRRRFSSRSTEKMQTLLEENAYSRNEPPSSASRPLERKSSSSSVHSKKSKKRTSSSSEHTKDQHQQHSTSSRPSKSNKNDDDPRSLPPQHSTTSNSQRSPPGGANKPSRRSVLPQEAKAPKTLQEVKTDLMKTTSTTQKSSRSSRRGSVMDLGASVAATGVCLREDNIEAGPKANFECHRGVLRPVISRTQPVRRRSSSLRGPPSPTNFAARLARKVPFGLFGRGNKPTKRGSVRSEICLLPNEEHGESSSDKDTLFDGALCCGETALFGGSWAARFFSKNFPLVYTGVVWKTVELLLAAISLWTMFWVPFYWAGFLQISNASVAAGQERPNILENDPEQWCVRADLFFHLLYFLVAVVLRFATTFPDFDSGKEFVEYHDIRRLLFVRANIYLMAATCIPWLYLFPLEHEAIDTSGAGSETTNVVGATTVSPEVGISTNDSESVEEALLGRPQRGALHLLAGVHLFRGLLHLTGIPAPWQQYLLCSVHSSYA